MNIRDSYRWLPIIVTTIVLLVGSYALLIYVNRSMAERKDRELNRILDQAAVDMKAKFSTAVDYLYNIRGFIGLTEMTPGRWKDYFAVNNLEENYPDVYSFAYVEKVKREGLSEFEKTMRKNTDPLYKNYSVFPVTNSTDTYPIRYLHSADPDVETLLGFDFQYSKKTISTIQSAITTDGPAISELAHLDLVIPSNKKTGYEVILPVYSTIAISEFPIEQRKDHLIGFVGVWIKAESLSETGSEMAGVRFSLYDGPDKIFTTGRLENNPIIQLTKTVQLLNRNFRIVLESDRSYQLPFFDRYLPNLTLIVAVLIDLLWLMSVYTILSSRKQAITFAGKVTKDLNKFKQAVDGVSDHVVITDPDGVINYANASAERITGYPVSEIVGRKPSLWGGQMPKEFYQNFWKIIKEDKKPFWGEIKNKRKNGELYEAEIHVSPILNEEGELLFFVGIEKDLSRRKSIEKMKTEFIALASHQLRTPLSAVKWFSEMLLDGDAGKMTKMQEKYVTKINESNEREIQIVNALLNVSRIESGKIVVVAKQTNLKDMVENILSDFKVNLVGENKELIYTVDKKLPNISIDPDLIKHVYSNLLSNALLYTSEGGSISVKVYIKENKIVSEVTDNGIGIPKKEQERIFEKFFRASNATKKYTEGTGLGLYLTKTIVESSGGELWFTSTEGKGTTFKFTLPIKEIRRRQTITKKPPLWGAA